MRLTRLEIQNYKSLRKIAMEPTPLMALVGPNASGKTNFADALDFLGITYRLGLEPAVAAKGGYENICYRASRRSKAPIVFRLHAANNPEWDPVLGRLSVEHGFELQALKEDAALFALSREDVVIPVWDRHGLLRQSGVVLHRQKSTVTCRSNDLLEQVGLSAPRDRNIEYRVRRLPPSQLALAILEEEVAYWDFSESLGSLRVFQLHPRACREPGVPTPTAELDRFGSNLPAALDHLKKHFTGSYAALLETVRKVLPSVESLDTSFTHTKRLALFLRERGYGRPWPAEDISDGTLQTIALLVALFDPRSKVVVIEEPENSIHPWALRNFVEAARQASTQKQVFLTTHSPVLIDQLRPEELWVVRRPGAETLIDPLPRLDPTVTEAWGEGKFTLSEYLDSGALPDAVPAAGSGR